MLGESGAEVIDLAESAGLILDEAQRTVLTGGMGESAETGRWETSEVAVIEPRQNGKGSILEARALGGLFLFREQLIVWTAHEFKTAREGFLRTRQYVDNYDHLRRQVKSVRVGAGEEGIELKNGSRLRFLARSGGSGRGFSGDCVFLDEAYALTDDQMAALLPTISARENPQIWYMSSAPLTSSAVLRRICARGRIGGAGLAYFEWCADDDAASDDPKAWAAANPALGDRIREEAVIRELGSMDDADFRRERLGIWAEDATSLIPAGKWAALQDADSKALDPVTFAVDVRPDRSGTSIGSAGLRSDGRAHIELVDRRPGTGWVVARLVELQKRWEPADIILDPSGPAGSLIKELEDAGIEPRLVSGREMTQACGALYDAVVDGKLRHRGQTEVTRAVEGATTRPLGDAWAWNRKTPDVDISPLVAVTLALHGVNVEAQYEVLESIW